MQDNKNNIELVSDSSFVYYLYLITYVLALFVLTIVAILSFNFVIIAVLLIPFTFLIIFYRKFLKERKVEVIRSELLVRVTSYLNYENSFSFPLVSITAVKKRVPGAYKILYSEMGIEKEILFRSLDMDFKFFIPFVSYFENNSDVEYLEKMVNYAKKIK
jgi:hypothetical protein